MSVPVQKFLSKKGISSCFFFGAYSIIVLVLDNYLTRKFHEREFAVDGFATDN